MDHTMMMILNLEILSGHLNALEVEIKNLGVCACVCLTSSL